MSKLYSKYVQLKQQNPSTIYLFKSGIFYIALDEDAIKLSESLKLNLTKLNDQVVKVGFPVSSRERYVRFMDILQIPYQFVDDTYGVIENYSDYYNNEKLKSIVNEILDLDFNDIGFIEGYNILRRTQNKLKEIYSVQTKK